MGYTHYWRFHRDKLETEPLRKTFENVSNEIKTLLDSLPQKPKTGYYTDQNIILKGGLGEGKPIINETEIWFNGDDETGMDHETFGISWKDQEPFGFCKTAHKPYDLAVCVSLLSFLNHYGSKIFNLSSDGGASEWQEAVDLYNQIMRKKIENPFSSESVEA